MTKQEAKSIFGGTQRALAAAVGLGESAVSQWPEVLTQRQADLVRGAAVRLGVLPVPKQVA